MDIVLAAILRRAANLTAESIPCADAVADLRPVGAVVVRVVGPGSGHAQTRNRLFGEGEPVAGRLQVGGRQVERLLAEVFARQPTAFAEAGDLRRYLEFAPGFGKW